MYYKNGRECHAGDIVVNANTGHLGLLYDPIPGSTTCNARLAEISNHDSYITINEFLHFDDVKLALSGTIPDSSLTDTQLGIGLGLE